MTEIASRKRLSGLDGLKAIGCCLVAFFWHYQHFGKFDNPPFYKIFFLLYQSGGLAVELFLMISGYTMALGYIGRIWKDEMNFREYIVRRMKKVWIISTITLLVVTVEQCLYLNLTGEVFVVKGFDFYHFVLNLFLLQAGWFENSYSFNSPAWFLSTLMLCYIVFYILLKLTKNNKKFLAIGALLIIAVGYICLCVKSTLPFLHSGFAARGYMCFFIGVILYLLHEKSVKSTLIVPIVGFILIVATFFVSKITGVDVNVRQILCIWVVFPTAIILAVNVRVCETLLSVKPLKNLAGISMEVFLWHFPIQLLIVICNIVFNININYTSKLFYLFYVALVIFVSYCSNVIMKRVTNLKRRELN